MINYSDNDNSDNGNSNSNDNNINGLAYSVNRLIPIRFAKTCTIGNSMIIIIIIIINIKS